MASFPCARRLLVAVVLLQLPVAQGDEPATVTAPPVLVDANAKPRWESVEDLAKAADAGDAKAAFEYARLLEAGDQVKADAQRALQYYRRAADAGEGNALFRLGKIHHDGLLGVPVDHPRAFALYRQAAAAGVPEAMFNLGAMLVSARGVKRDYTEGLAWLLVAAQHGADASAGIEQVRRRLARRPNWIAAAERRATALQAELKEPMKPSTPAASPPPPARAAPTVEMERPGAARPAPPAVTIPKPALALPTPPPPAEERPEE